MIRPDYQKLTLIYQRPEIKIPVEVILSVFASIFLIAVAIRPTLITVTELKKKIVDQELVEKKLQTKINKLINANNQLNQFSNDLTLFARAVPENYTYANLAKKIELIASQQNLFVKSISFSSAMVTGNNKDKKENTKNKEWRNGDNIIKEFSIHFDLLGNEFQLINFLTEVENLDRVSMIYNVELAKTMEQDGLEHQIRASGIIKSYYLVKDDTNDQT